MPLPDNIASLSTRNTLLYLCLYYSLGQPANMPVPMEPQPPFFDTAEDLIYELLQAIKAGGTGGGGTLPDNFVLQVPGTSTTQVMSQEASTKEDEKRIPKTAIVHTSGSSLTDILSQKGVTDLQALRLSTAANAGLSGTGVRFPLLSANGTFQREDSARYDTATKTFSLVALNGLSTGYSFQVLNAAGTSYMLRFFNNGVLELRGETSIIQAGYKEDGTPVASGDSGIVIHNNQLRAYRITILNGPNVMHVDTLNKRAVFEMGLGVDTTGNDRFLIDQDKALSTNTAVPVVLRSIALEAGEMVMVEAKILAKTADSSIVYSGHKRQLWRRIGAAGATLVGDVEVIGFEQTDGVTLNGLTFAANGNNVDIRFEGNAAHAYDATCTRFPLRKL
jgi:hypothetical protein